MASHERVRRGSLHKTNSIQTVAAQIADEWTATSKPAPFPAPAGEKRSTSGGGFEGLRDEQLDRGLEGAEAERSRRYGLEDVYLEDEPEQETPEASTAGDAPEGSNPLTAQAWEAMNR